MTFLRVFVSRGYVEVKKRSGRGRGRGGQRDKAEPGNFNIVRQDMVASPSIGVWLPSTLPA